MERKIHTNEGSICVPIIGPSLAKVMVQVNQAINCKADLIELRVDLWDSVNIGQMKKNVDEISKLAYPLPILLTYRSVVEGGKGSLEIDRLVEFFETIIASKNIDMIDFELSMDRGKLLPLIVKAKSENVRVVLSYHNFNETPDDSFLMDKLKLAQDLGGDLGKIAVMPKGKKDVIRLLSVVEEANSILDLPIVAISMGELGWISRLCGYFFGSAISFASLPGQASAPGQFEITKLKEILSLIP